MTISVPAAFKQCSRTSYSLLKRGFLLGHMRSSMFGTRLPPHLANTVRDFAERNAISESAVLRIAVATYFAIPRSVLIDASNDAEQTEPTREEEEVKAEKQDLRSKPM